jgi:hypothetical protein
MPRYNSFAGGAFAFGSKRLPTVPFPGNGNLIMDPANWGGGVLSFVDTSSGSNATWTFSGGISAVGYHPNNGGTIAGNGSSVRLITPSPITGTVDFTIMAWFSCGATRSDGGIVGWNTNGNGNTGIEAMGGTGAIRMIGPNSQPAWNGGINVWNVAGAGTYSPGSGNAANQAAWYHVAYRRQSGIGTFFFQGNPLGSTNDTMSFFSGSAISCMNTSPLGGTRFGNGTTQAPGRYGVMQFFNFALSDAQVLAQRNSLLSRFS